VSTDAPAESEALGRRLTWRDAVSSVLGLGLGGVLIVYGMPLVLDTSWAEIGAQLARVRPGSAALMALLLVAGLFCYTWVLMGSLPGLTHLQALKGNAVTSLVGNLIPLGAAVGVALWVLMTRSWGFSRRAVSASLLVTSLWNLLARIALPVIGCLLLVAGPVDAPQLVVRGALVAGAVGTAAIATASAMVLSDTVARWVVLGLDRVAGLLRRSGSRVRRLEALMTDQRARVRELVRSGFWPMTLGMVGQFTLLFCLYWTAARTVGVELPLIGLVCAYAFRQLLTVFAVTPGGLGVTEVGTAGMLVLLGAGAGAASATALLYAVYAHLVVVPFGVVALASWWYGSGPGGRDREETRLVG
jgi:uncharacterized membrane protein YbhN (UPF0104 family)